MLYCILQCNTSTKSNVISHTMHYWFAFTERIERFERLFSILPMNDLCTILSDILSFLTASSYQWSNIKPQIVDYATKLNEITKKALEFCSSTWSDVKRHELTSIVHRKFYN